VYHWSDCSRRIEKKMAPGIPEHNVVLQQELQKWGEYDNINLLSPPTRQKKNENPGRKTTYFEDHLTSLADRSPAETFCSQGPENLIFSSIMEFLKRPKFPQHNQDVKKITWQLTKTTTYSL
jgi:hypothetical protein